jgi:MOSC domain-containing protein YiiM
MKERWLLRTDMAIIFTLWLGTLAFPAEGFLLSKLRAPTAPNFPWRSTVSNQQCRYSFTTNSPLLLSARTTSDPDAADLALGRVVRVAVREFHPVDSKPSSRNYTTRKVARDSIQVSKEGVALDYNHYRTLALDGTLDRALSILTTDCMELLKSHKFPVHDGDLGENVLVAGIDYRFFIPGNVYRFAPSVEDNEDEKGDVIVEITEFMEPCANLCKLSYINDPDKTPKERIATCQLLLNILDQQPGLRGWYAKVLQGGAIAKNCRVLQVNDYKSKEEIESE